MTESFEDRVLSTPGAEERVEQLRQELLSSYCSVCHLPHECCCTCEECCGDEEGR